MRRMNGVRIVATLVLGATLLAAGTESFTCTAYCSVEVRTSQWTCNCQWSAPFGLACAQRPWSVPAGATIVSPKNAQKSEGAPSQVIELTGGTFELIEGHVTFTATHEFKPVTPYSIPYLVQDQQGQVIQRGALEVAAINVK